MRSYRIALGLMTILLTMAGPESVTTAHAQSQTRPLAQDVLKRAAGIVRVDHVLRGIPRILGESENQQGIDLMMCNVTDVAQPELQQSYLLLLRVDATQVPPAAPGTLRFAFARGPDFPVQIVQSQLLSMGDCAFENVIWYLYALRGTARNMKRVPGPLHEGIAAIVASDQQYRTEHAWSLCAKEQAAAVYLLVAAQQLTEDSQLARVACEPKIVSLDENLVRTLLERLYGPANQDPKLVENIAKMLVASPSAEPQEERLRGGVRMRSTPSWFDVTNLLVPGMETPSDLEDGYPEAARQPAMRAIQVIEQRPELFPNLAIRYRLLQRCEAVARGHLVVSLARQALGELVADANKTALQQQAEELDARRAKWIAAFDREVSARGNSPSAMRNDGSVGWDPHGAAELTALLIGQSVPVAKIRVRMAEFPDWTRDDVQKALDQALLQDARLDAFFRRYGKPSCRVLDDPTAPMGLVLQLDWTLVPPGRKSEDKGPIDHVCLVMMDAFAGGGQGSPIEPGLVDTQLVSVSPPAFSGPAGLLPLATLKPRQLVQGFDELTAGKQLPKNIYSWNQAGTSTRFLGPSPVEIAISPKERLVGTATQQVWAKRAAGEHWKWISLAQIRTDDMVCCVGAQGCEARRIVATSRPPSNPAYVRLNVAGSDHAFVNGFVARCEYDSVPSIANDGVLETTPMLLMDDRARSLVDVSCDLTAGPITCTGFRFDAKPGRAHKDLLIRLDPEESRAIYRICYELHGQRRTIGVGRSHGFLVPDEKEPVQAHRLRQGDLLVCDEKGATAKVLEIGIEQPSDTSTWTLRHPWLLRSEWIQANGILVHARNNRGSQFGVMPSTKITMASRSTDLEARSPLVGDHIALSELRRSVSEPRGDQRQKEVVAWRPTLSAVEVFQPDLIARPIKAVSGDSIADLIRIRTDDGRTLECGADTLLFCRDGDGSDGATRVVPVKASDIKPKHLVLALDVETRQTTLRLYGVSACEEVDLFREFGGNGYVNVLNLELRKSPVATICDFETSYNTVFANTLLVMLPKPRIEKDLSLLTQGGGGAPGQDMKERVDGGTTSDTRQSVTQTNAKTPPRPALSGRVIDPQAQALPLFTSAELEILRQSWESLERAFHAHLATPPKWPATPEGRQRWDRFAAVCLPASFQTTERFDRDQLQMCFDRYYHYREFFLSTGHPNALESMALVGVRLGVILHEAGYRQVAKKLLSDLLTVQMRLALRPASGPALWNNGELLVRDTARFLLEFALLDAEPGGHDFESLWSVPWPAGDWGDLLQSQIGQGTLHRNVLVNPSAGDPEVVLFHLILLMDLRGRRPAAEPSEPNGELLDGFVSPGFLPGGEFSGQFKDRFGNKRKQ